MTGMGRKRGCNAPDYKPTLNRHLLEGAFSQAMNQVLQSLDMCRSHKVTDMSLKQHVKGLMNITGSEIAVALMLVEGRHSSTLVRKHRLWVQRANTCMRQLSAVDDEGPLEGALTAIVQWIQDAHLILHEDTPNKTREYLGRKFLTDEEADALDGCKHVPSLN